MRILLDEWLVKEMVELRTSFEHSELALCERLSRHAACTAAMLHRKKRADGTWTDWRVYPHPDIDVAQVDWDDRMSRLKVKEVWIDTRILDRASAPSPYKDQPLFGSF